MEQGTNTRFIVSTRTGGPKELYEFYARRGESENWIKDFKLHMKAERLSCHRASSPTSSGCCLHAWAYWLIDTLRKKLVGSGVRRMQLDTLRLRLIKDRREGQGADDEGPAASGLGTSGPTLMASSFAVLRRPFMNNPG